jgi:predicted transcriptional regulator
MLELSKWQLLLITILKIGITSFNTQKIYLTRNHFYLVIKHLEKTGYIRLDKENGNEKFYTLTLKGEILARILR